MKTLNEQQNVGHAKYVVNHHNGEKKHKDGSPFFDIALFSNKRKKDQFVKKLRQQGYGTSKPVADEILKEFQAFDLAAEKGQVPPVAGVTPANDTIAVALTPIMPLTTKIKRGKIMLQYIDLILDHPANSPYDAAKNVKEALVTMGDQSEVFQRKNDLVLIGLVGFSTDPIDEIATNLTNIGIPCAAQETDDEASETELAVTADE